MRLARLACFATLAALACGCGGYKLPKTAGVDPKDGIVGSMSLGEARFKPSVCKGVDLSPDYATLDENALMGFLKKGGFPVRIERARSDLVYVELQINPDRDEWVRLRVATLQSAPQAALELHHAVLQVGEGSWGVHRSNLAVLGPPGSVPDVLAFAERTKLACWGVLTMAGADDAMVVPGAYREL